MDELKIVQIDDTFYIFIGNHQTSVSFTEKHLREDFAFLGLDQAANILEKELEEKENIQNITMKEHNHLKGELFTLMGENDV